MKSVFVETSVLLLAVGGDHPLRAASRRVVAAAEEGMVRLHMSVEGGQEFLFHRMRRSSAPEAIEQVKQRHRRLGWHPFDVEGLHRAPAHLAPGAVRGRAAVHAATALVAGFDEIVSSDTDFDGIPGLVRLDPATAFES
ncbi:MAG: type II toxin-antitoxin system VapC family toxin [bacterium]|nr:type II toxin-antitoxin system VapC family toxin [bacterium]